MKTEDTPTWHRLRDAINKSAKLSQDEKHQEALELVDRAIADAILQGHASWVLTLSHHAAVIAAFLGDHQLVKKYYEQSLAYVPENPRALYGLAKVAREEGESETARQYAFKCYKALGELEDEDVVKQGLLDLVLKDWPEVAGM